MELNTSIIALVPKPGATTEAQLRPIGIMPYTSSVWVAVRRQVTKDWSLRIHNGRHLGASAMAYNIQYRVEMAHWRGQAAILAFLDRSKCCEWVPHRPGAQNAVDSGLQDRIANMVLAQHAGNRVLHAPSSSGRMVSGGHGLIAGCSFAKDLLKSFLLSTADVA